MTPDAANNDLDSLAGGSAGPEVVTEGSVRGERGSPSVNRVRSLQSTVSSVMACGLMIILGVAMLTWYYTSVLSRQMRARQSAQAASANRAQGELPLPALGRFAPLRTSATGVEHSPASEPSFGSDTAPTQPQPRQPPPLQLTQSASNGMPIGAVVPLYGGASSVYGATAAQYGGSPPKTAAQLALERRLSGAAFARISEAGVMVSSAAVSGPVPGSVPAAVGRPEGEITTLLRPSLVAAAQARILPTQRFLLAKGAFIDCTLETAIDSTLPGMTTCITANDTFGVDGNVVLLERGTKLIGETRGQVQQGAPRIFVLWTEARTPSGIVVPLDSPGADQLGRSGLAGKVDHHFWDRFGAAVLISTLDGAVQAAVQSAGRGGGAVIYNPSSSEGIVTDVLKGSVNIAPTVTKNNGDRIQVFVARDLDFRSVYELRSAATER